VIGVASGFVPSRAIRARARLALAVASPGFGGSTGLESMSSIGVASTVLPP
jgi:hypothetical protein